MVYFLCTYITQFEYTFEVKLTCPSLECHKELELNFLELAISSLDLTKFEFETSDFKTIWD